MEIEEIPKHISEQVFYTKTIANGQNGKRKILTVNLHHLEEYPQEQIPPRFQYDKVNRDNKDEKFKSLILS